MGELGKLSANIERAVATCGTQTLLSQAIEECDPMLLDVRSGNLSDHVAMQPSLIAFWGAKLAEAIREHQRSKEQYDAWWRLKYKVIKDQMLGKSTIDDTKNALIATHGTEYEEWQQHLNETQRICDNIEAWYNAIKQKSFAMNQHISLHNDEWSTNDNRRVPEPRPAKRNETFEPEDDHFAGTQQPRSDKGFGAGDPNAAGNFPPRNLGVGAVTEELRQFKKKS